MKRKFFSFSILVSGFPHSEQSTKVLAYSFIFSFILEALTFVPIITEPLFFISPGAANSFKINFNRCSGGLLRTLAIWRKLLRMVLLPWMCPLILGISNLALSKIDLGSFSLTFFSKSLYSILSGEWGGLLLYKLNCFWIL